MNKWKIAFWFCLTLLLLVIAYSTYSIIDQGVTFTHMKEGYTDTENDLDNISKIINETDFSKNQIKTALKQHHLFEYMEFDKDTVSLDRVELIFKDEKLFKVLKQW